MNRAASTALLLSFLAVSLSAQDYRWGSVCIGGGGYITGVVIHPLDSNLVYIRTDIGGAYRWDSENSRWIPLLDWLDPDIENLRGVDGIAVDPNNVNVVYAALGKSINLAVNGVYKSVDQGTTWEEVLTVANRRQFMWAFPAWVCTGAAMGEQRSANWPVLRRTQTG
jgi:hypothetical protein